MRHLILLLFLCIGTAGFSVRFLNTSEVGSPSVYLKDGTGSEIDAYVGILYDKLQAANAGIPSALLEKGVKGYWNLKSRGKVVKDIITLIDMDKPGIEKRMWIVDVQKGVVLKNTYVAHGKNSGENFAISFSNKVNSHQSSLGFYVTGQTYHGKHGLSLRLNGMDIGFNDNASRRAIVLHGADYVSEEFIRKHGRLGRSHGCPAVPVAENKEIIELIKGGSLLFINGNSVDYRSDHISDQFS